MSTVYTPHISSYLLIPDKPCRSQSQFYLATQILCIFAVYVYLCPLLRPFLGKRKHGLTVVDSCLVIGDSKAFFPPDLMWPNANRDVASEQETGEKKRQEVTAFAALNHRTRGSSCRRGVGFSVQFDPPSESLKWAELSN